MSNVGPKLNVCARCGWYDGFHHSQKCEPALGQAAGALVERLMAAGARATQLGYGTGRVNFQLAAEEHCFSITLRVDAPGRFSLQDVQLLGSLTADQVVALAEALKPFAPK